MKWSKGWLLGLAVVLWAAGAFGSVASDWADMSGGKAAKVVYWKSNNTITKMDLVTGTETTVVSGASNAINEAPCPFWSPDGQRIGFRDKGSGNVKVCYEDGSNLKTIAFGRGRMFSFWSSPTDGNLWVCVNTPSGIDAYPQDTIRRYRLDASNTIIDEVVVLSGPAIGGKYRDYVTMSGDFVAWMDGDMNEPTGGDHNCPILKISTSTYRYAVANDDDACSIDLKEDGSGTYCFNHGNHKADLEIKNWAGTLIGAITPIGGGEIYYARWSNDGDYMAHMGARGVALANGQGYIRKVSDESSVYLGIGIWSPDIWVEVGPPASITVTYPDGGENWTSGSGEKRTVTWTSEGDVGNVKIEFSSNGTGGPWTTLVASTADDGTEEIDVPEVDSAQCRIRVSELDGSPSDMSDDNFTITFVDTTPPEVSVTSVVINGTASDPEVSPPLIVVAGTQIGYLATFSEEVTLTGSTITIEAWDTKNTTTITLDVTVP